LPLLVSATLVVVALGESCVAAGVAAAVFTVGLGAPVGAGKWPGRSFEYAAETPSTASRTGRTLDIFLRIMGTT
jgi:hypothetical protein